MLGRASPAVDLVALGRLGPAAGQSHSCAWRNLGASTRPPTWPRDVLSTIFFQSRQFISEGLEATYRQRNET